MLSFYFGISNPWSKQKFKTLKYFNKVMGNKEFEFQVYKHKELFGFGFGYTHRQSHAGLRLDLSLFGYNVEISILDMRHWDSDNCTWEEE